MDLHTANHREAHGQLLLPLWEKVGMRGSLVTLTPPPPSRGR